MLLTLTAHPLFPSSIKGVQVEAHRTGEQLNLRYVIGGENHIVWPPPAAPTRTDGLWKTTCFELFLRFDGDERYVEFNFSPSGQWAAYVFAGYREGMTPLAITPPSIQRLTDGVQVACDLSVLARGARRMALTAVIEARDGTKSYWALAHPPGPPDFHHPTCFAARLPAPGDA